MCAHIFKIGTEADSGKYRLLPSSQLYNFVLFPA